MSYDNHSYNMTWHVKVEISNNVWFQKIPIPPPPVGGGGGGAKRPRKS